MVFSDAPYNVVINGHVSGLGKHKHREFAMAWGEMTTGDYTAFLTRAFAHLARYSTNGSIHYQCIDWRHVCEMSDAGMANYTELKNICVWDKGSGGMGSFYRSGHEFVFVFKSGAEPHTTAEIMALQPANLYRSGRQATGETGGETPVSPPVTFSP